MIGIVAASAPNFRRGATVRAPVAPSWSVNPSLLSGAVEGGSTACTVGTFDGTQPIGIACQWRESATVGGTYADISGAVGASSPTWSAGDVAVNPWKRCRVTLTGPGGSASFDTTAVQVTASSPPGSGTATLTWGASDDTDVTGYKVYWGAAPWAETFNSGTISGRTTATYTATGLESGRIYFKLRTLFAGGEGEDYSLGYMDIA